jgi:parvulin-like peptidyl-prolyl isomerase
MYWRLCWLSVAALLCLGCSGSVWPWSRTASNDEADQQAVAQEESGDDSAIAAASDVTDSTQHNERQSPPAPDADTRVSEDSRPGRTVQAPVLRVNRDIITVQDVLEPIAEVLEREAADLTVGEYQARVMRRARQEIRDQIDAALLYERASRKISEEAEAKLGKAIDKIIRDRINQHYRGSQTAFEMYLERYGKTIEDVRERERRVTLVQGYVVDQIIPRIHITRRELLRYFHEHQADFETKAEVEMHLIDVPGWAFLPGAGEGAGLADGRREWAAADEGARAEALRQARSRVEQAAEQLRAGAAIAPVAKSHSHGINASKGGDWGMVTPGELQGRWAPLNDVLATLASGQTSDIIEGTDGFFIVKAGQKQPGRSVSFEEAQPEIEAKLVNEQKMERFSTLMERLHSEATISDYDEQLLFLTAVVTAAPPHPSAQGSP